MGTGFGIGTPDPHHSDRETTSNRAESRSAVSEKAPRPSWPVCTRERAKPLFNCLMQFKRSRRTDAIHSMMTLFCISEFPLSLNRNDSKK